MIYCLQKRKPSSLTSLLDIILLVLFAQTIFTANLVPPLKKELEQTQKDHEDEIRAIENIYSTELEEIKEGRQRYKAQVSELKDKLEISEDQNTILKIENENLEIEQENYQTVIKQQKEAIQRQDEIIHSKEGQINEIANGLQTLLAGINKEDLDKLMDFSNLNKKDIELLVKNISKSTAMDLFASIITYSELTKLYTPITVHLNLNEITIKMNHSNKNIKKISLPDGLDKMYTSKRGFTIESISQVKTDLIANIKDLAGTGKDKFLILISYGDKAYDDEVAFINKVENLIREKSDGKEIITNVGYFSGGTK